ncbi:hypothetical protein ABZU86_09195 [Streptomyces sp. NPDC005271]|uniref:hypothetical protein n=1 Tax=Streptomyces sp. NPDC005271 TaxID=3157030 RepID=UPI0033A03067
MSACSPWFALHASGFSSHTLSFGATVQLWPSVVLTCVKDAEAILGAGFSWPVLTVVYRLFWYARVRALATHTTAALSGPGKGESDLLDANYGRLLVSFAPVQPRPDSPAAVLRM